MEGLIVPSKFYGVAAAGRPAIFVGDPEGEIAQIIREEDCGDVVPSGGAELLVECIERSYAERAESASRGRRARGVWRRVWSMKSEFLQQDPVLDEIARRLVKAYRPERIYLFGSMARDEAGPDSDYDLMLIVGDDAPSEVRQSKLAYQVLWGVGRAADVLVWTRGQFGSRLHIPASLPATVMREGKLLHAA
jgi:predicted nucleotidyltransferase